MVAIALTTKPSIQTSSEPTRIEHILEITAHHFLIRGQPMHQLSLSNFLRSNSFGRSKVRVDAWAEIKRCIARHRSFS